jgi:predicted ribosomally synthesized peptide with nif11-like leader
MKFDELSPEMQEKAKACKSPEEMLALAKEEGYELSDDELSSISGGWGDPNCSDHNSCNDYCYRLNTI